MLGVISWRNVWRNKGRTLVVMLATMLGVAAISFSTSFMRTFVVNYVDNAIDDQYSHIQIAYPDFRTNQDIHLNIDHGEEIASSIKKMQGVYGVTARTTLMGMASSAKSSDGAQIYGVVPDDDGEVFGIRNAIVEGEYFNGIKNNPAIIGRAMAEKFNARVKSKIVLTFTDPQNNVVYGAFRVAGIFNSSSPALDQSAVFVQKSDLERLVGEEELTHIIAVRVEDQERLSEITAAIASKHPNLQVDTWKELAPELELVIGQSMTSLYIFMSIILLALAFGIVNTMLMAVLERVKELGMLMAVGMNKTRIFLMVMLETIIVTSIGGPAGFLLGFGVIRYFNRNGLDLSNYSKGLEEWGFDTVMYPHLEFYFYLIIAIGIVVTAVLAAIYPAIKAIKLKPAEALHKI